MNVIALVISFVAFIVSAFALKISLDNNKINYCRINFDLISRFSNLDDNDKQLMKRFLERNDPFEKEDHEIRERIMNS